MTKVGVIGCGYWGKNIVRNLAAMGRLAAVADADLAVASSEGQKYSVPSLSSKALIVDPDIAAVAIAAPAAQHYELARQALAANKDVFVEKPLALRVEDAEQLIALATETGRILMVGHLMQYHPGFRRLQDLVVDGELGKLSFIYSTRLNLGRFRREENILWSFAPHDISMILSLASDEPDGVDARGSWHLSKDVADISTTDLTFESGLRAHLFVSWLHPVKEQKLVVIGATAMAVLDDGRDWDSKLTIYRHQIDWEEGTPSAQRAEPEPVEVQASEPLRSELEHFVRSVERRETPLTDGREGARVLRVLARAEESMRANQKVTTANSLGDEVMIHPSAWVDQPCEIGQGTKVWHFSHIMSGARVGRSCVLGQNVMIGRDVRIGDGCKIQNNVSVYTGVTLGDDVFCGPSVVFTNVSTPRADVDRSRQFENTMVESGASLGANATIVCGNIVGHHSFVAAGAVVTKDVPPHALVAGVPARRIGWVGHAGERLTEDLVCPRTGRRYKEVAPDRLEEIEAS